MKRVTGLGGILADGKDAKKIMEWDENHLGLNANRYGATFDWYEGHDPNKKAQTPRSPFAETTKYLDPSAKEVRIKYRVENLEELVEELKKEGVTIVDEMETYDYGKFIHILDPEGNKIELWEPID